MATLELKQVRKNYGNLEVVHGVDLFINNGEFCVLVGPSGCGKSTLLRMIAGLEKITKGEILIDSQVVNNISAARRGLAMVFQSYALYPHMSVRQNLAFGLENLKMNVDEIDKRILEAARMDAASEWSIYWKIVFPLALPAIAVLGILSVIWRWNDLILPMIAVSTTKTAYTIQLCLLDFQGEYVAQEHYRLAMTVVSLIPTTLVFVFLQRYITSGIASTGIK